MPESSEFRDAAREIPRLSTRTVLISTITVAAIIFVLRLNVLHDPPYWDAAMGAWGEANAVVGNDFDISKNLFREPMWLQGGEAVYRISLPVYAIAIGMTNLSPPHLILVVHVVSIILAALMAVLFFASMRRTVGSIPAFLATIALMTSPLFSSQIDMVGIDLPALLFGWIAISSCVDRKYSIASLASLLAFFSKPSGMVYTMTIVGFITIRLLASIDPKYRGDFRRNLIGLGINVFSLSIQWSILSWLFARGYGTNWRVLMLIPYWCPDIALFLIVAVLGFAFYCVLDRKSGETIPALFHRLTDRHGLFFISLIVLTLLFVGLTKVSAIPRYLIYGYPPLFALFTGILFWRRDQASIGMKVLIGVIIINLLNWNGLLYPSAEACGRWEGFSAGVASHEGSFIERSRAFRTDLREVKEAIAAAQRGGAPVIAGGAFANYLTSPRLGYVNDPVHGYLSDGLRDSYHSMKSAGALLQDLPREIVFINCLTTLGESFPLFEMPKPNENDEILYSSGGEWPIVVFKRKWDLAVSNEDLSYWIAARLWPIPNPFTGGFPSEVNTPRYRIQQFTELGRKDLAHWVADEAIRTASSDSVRGELKAIKDKIDDAPSSKK